MVQRMMLKRQCMLMLIVCIGVTNVAVMLLTNNYVLASKKEKTEKINNGYGIAVNGISGDTKEQTETRMKHLPQKKQSHGSSPNHTQTRHLYGFKKWPDISDIDLQTITRSSILKQFQPILTRSERTEIVNVFFATVHLLQKLKLQYALTAGTLLGSYLHHNMSPWDDDIDILTNVDNKDALLRAFKGTNSTHQMDGVTLSLVMFGESLWKICKNGTIKMGIKNKLYWPFIDVLFYKDYGRYIGNFGRLYKKETLWDKRKIFPLQLRPFEGTLQPVPCDVEYVLKKLYTPWFEKDRCTSLGWNHRTEYRMKNVIQLSCKILYPYYPFVRRMLLKGYDIELLRVEHTILGHYISEKRICS